MKTITTFILFFLVQIMSAQLVINELDSDSPSIDDQEFIEIKSDTPNFSLDGYIIVLFNGSSSGENKSYYTIDLDGYTTDINGLLLIGSNGVSPTPQYLISANVIQNGADAVAIYQADADDFPEYTLATTNNLIDALVYGTGDPDATSLMALLGITDQFDEDANGNQSTESIQRANDGTYFTAAPTPRQLNDGSGVILNGITISIDQEQYDEGGTIDIVFTSEENVDEDLTINFSLSNGSFDANDFTGPTSVIISEGSSTATASIVLVDDTDDEGDEELIVSISNLPQEYITLNDNLLIRIVDNDFVVADFGTPVNPTYGIVESTQQAGYYNSLDGLADDNLRQALQDIIADPSVVRTQTYADVIDILKEADQNPANSNEVWLVYTEQGRPKLDFQTTSVSTGTWNREHTYPRSRGGFNSIQDDEIADGPDVFWTTNADSLRHGNSDAHALRAVDGPENSSRNNQHYGQYTGPAGTQESFYGDVARSVFYMAVRYNGLEIVNGFPEGVTGELGDLQTLLEWHRNDPPDDFEMNRNNVVYEWQNNRNPFIDQPDLIEHIWGNQVGNVWEQELRVGEEELSNLTIYPNPTKGQINISGIKGANTIEIYSILGKRIASKKADGPSSFNLNLSSGIYLVKISTEGSSIVKKVVVK